MMEEQYVPLPLPTYNIFRFARENPFAFSLVSATITVLLTALIWKYWRSKVGKRLQRKLEPSHRDCSENSLSQGHFNIDTLKGIRRRPTANEHLANADKNEQPDAFNSYLDYEKLGPVYPKAESLDRVQGKEEEVKGQLRIESDESEEDSTKKWNSKKKSISEKLVENDEVVGSIKTLHGKLATADLNLKARKFEQSMTEEEKQEEAMVRKKQLESIYSLMAADKEKFGVTNQSDLFDQMKLYSFYK